jgi:tumor protein p53-inducible protein 3
MEPETGEANAMRAILVEKPGGPEVLALGEAPDPVPGAGEVLVRTRAAGVNRADLLQRMGRYPPPPGASPILGLELAGEVVGHGPPVHEDTPPGGPLPEIGAGVMALVTGGAYAEMASVPVGAAIEIPPGMAHTAAAAIPEAFLTAWMNLVELGGLTEGETVLIHAGASGVGSAAIQLARELGARVLATAGSEEKLEFCRGLGASAAINRRHEDFAEAALARTEGRGVDLILDFVGAPYWEGNLEALRRGGRLTLIGFLGGSRGEIDLGPLMRKNLRVTGTTVRGTPIGTKARVTGDFAAFALPRFADGRLKPLVDRVFPLAEAAEAHRYMGENRNRGKIILAVV